MFLHKRENGTYYVYWYENGKLKKRTTKQKLKSDALKFLTTFDPTKKKILFRNPSSLKR